MPLLCVSPSAVLAREEEAGARHALRVVVLHELRHTACYKEQKVIGELPTRVVKRVVMRGTLQRHSEGFGRASDSSCFQPVADAKFAVDIFEVRLDGVD